MGLIPPDLVLVTGKEIRQRVAISDTGWQSLRRAPEHDRDSWLILKFGRLEGAGIICDYTAAGDLLTVGH